MLSVHINMAGRGKRQVTYQAKKSEGGKETTVGSQSSSTKKDHSRHSYHPSTSSFNMGCPDANHVNFNYVDRRSFVTRERSFVRSQSGPSQMTSSQNPLAGALQRQRSFVLPGQLSKQNQIHQQGRDTHNRRRSAMAATTAANLRGKPALEIYKPPTLRYESNGEYIFNGDQYNGYPHQAIYTAGKPGLNIHAKEFVSSSTSSLHHSKSSGNLQQFRKHNLQHSKSGHFLREGTTNAKISGPSSPPRVHFKENDKENKTSSTTRPPSLALSSVGPLSSPVKRSKSLGSAADLGRKTASQNLDSSPLNSLGPFAQEVHNTILKAINDPNALSARQLMEVSRHLFTRVVESSRNAEPTAKLSIIIIENEKGETFLETLLNTCQEYFQERDRLLRSTPPGPYPGYVASHPRWIAFMSFLNEMYTQLKRRSVQLMTRRMRNSETAPGLLLLTLLAQCCHICLREQAVNSLAETECLFFVLTAVGKDIEVELPQQMGKVMAAARDAFLTSVHVPAVKKTLLQLIEMHAARWQLPASAVMYYYPGSSSAK